MKIPLRTDEARTYLESKYKEKFTLVSASAPSLDQPHAELFFYSASHPNDPVKVYDDYRSFSDNYYAILIREKMQARIEDAARTTGENTLIGFRFRGSAMNAALSDPENFEADLAAHREYFAVNLFVFVDAEKQMDESAFQGFLEQLLERGITGSVMLYEIGTDDRQQIMRSGFEAFMQGNNALEARYSSYIR